ncbi:MAG: hypothetical protein WC575_01405 [Patescibacteria group bacterium]
MNPEEKSEYEPKPPSSPAAGKTLDNASEEFDRKQKLVEGEASQAEQKIDEQARPESKPPETIMREMTTYDGVLSSPERVISASDFDAREAIFQKLYNNDKGEQYTRIQLEGITRNIESNKLLPITISEHPSGNLLMMQKSGENNTAVILPSIWQRYKDINLLPLSFFYNVPEKGIGYVSRIIKPAVVERMGKQWWVKEKGTIEYAETLEQAQYPKPVPETGATNQEEVDSEITKYTIKLDQVDVSGARTIRDVCPIVFQNRGESPTLFVIDEHGNKYSESKLSDMISDIYYTNITSIQRRPTTASLPETGKVRLTVERILREESSEKINQLNPNEEYFAQKLRAYTGLTPRETKRLTLSLQTELYQRVTISYLERLKVENHDLYEEVNQQPFPQVPKEEIHQIINNWISAIPVEQWREKLQQLIPLAEYSHETVIARSPVDGGLLRSTLLRIEQDANGYLTAIVRMDDLPKEFRTGKLGDEVAVDAIELARLNGMRLEGVGGEKETKQSSQEVKDNTKVLIEFGGPGSHRDYFYMQKEGKEWRQYVRDNMLNRTLNPEFEMFLEKFFEIKNRDPNPDRYIVEKPALIEWDPRIEEGFLKEKGVIYRCDSAVKIEKEFIESIVRAGITKEEVEKIRPVMSEYNKIRRQELFTPTDRERAAKAEFLKKYKVQRAFPSGERAEKGYIAPKGARYFLTPDSQGNFIVFEIDNEYYFVPDPNVEYTTSPYVISAFSIDLLESERLGGKYKELDINFPAKARRLSEKGPGGEEFEMTTMGYIGCKRKEQLIQPAPSKISPAVAGEKPIVQPKEEIKPSVSEEQREVKFEKKDYKQVDYLTVAAQEGYFWADKMHHSFDSLGSVFKLLRDSEESTTATYVPVEDPYRQRIMIGSYTTYLSSAAADIEGTNTHGTYIEVLSPGELKLDGDKWIITKRVKIRITSEPLKASEKVSRVKAEQPTIPESLVLKIDSESDNESEQYTIKLSEVDVSGAKTIQEISRIIFQDRNNMPIYFVIDEHGHKYDFGQLSGLAGKVYTANPTAGEVLSTDLLPQAGGVRLTVERLMQESIKDRTFSPEEKYFAKKLQEQSNLTPRDVERLVLYYQSQKRYPQIVKLEYIERLEQSNQPDLLKLAEELKHSAYPIISEQEAKKSLDDWLSNRLPQQWEEELRQLKPLAEYCGRDVIMRSPIDGGLQRGILVEIKHEAGGQLKAIVRVGMLPEKLRTTTWNDRAVVDAIELAKLNGMILDEAGGGVRQVEAKSPVDIEKPDELKKRNDLILPKQLVPSVAEAREKKEPLDPVAELYNRQLSMRSRREEAFESYGRPGGVRDKLVEELGGKLVTLPDPDVNLESHQDLPIELTENKGGEYCIVPINESKAYIFPNQWSLIENEIFRGALGLFYLREGKGDHIISVKKPAIITKEGSKWRLKDGDRGVIRLGLSYDELPSTEVPVKKKEAEGILIVGGARPIGTVKETKPASEEKKEVRGAVIFTRELSAQEKSLKNKIDNELRLALANSWRKHRAKITPSELTKLVDETMGDDKVTQALKERYQKVGLPVAAKSR